MAEIDEKLPPQAIEAEMAVLGSMLIEKEAIIKCLDIVDENDFYKEAHRRVFKAIKKLYLDNSAVDMITVSEELKKEKILDELGGAVFITNLLNSVVTAANVEHYANIVHEKSILRQIINIGTQITEEAYRSADSAVTILDRAQAAMLSIAQRGGDARGFVSSEKLVSATLEQIERRHADRKALPGLSTGYPQLDDMTGGLQSSNLIIVAGRPSMGKSSFCLNIVANVSIRNKLPVGIFSLEMAKEELMFRLICSEARVNSHRIRKGIIAKKEWPIITTAAMRIAEAPIFIDDTSNINVLDIRTRARRLATELNTMNKKLALIVIDYIQIIQGSGLRKNETRQQEIAEISRSLKSLSRELNIPVIAISQLSRRPEERGREGRPQLADLRESGALEQDADVVMFIYREEVYRPTDEDAQKGKAVLMIAKQRHGPCGKINMHFAQEYTRFEELEENEGE